MTSSLVIETKNTKARPRVSITEVSGPVISLIAKPDGECQQTR